MVHGIPFRAWTLSLGVGVLVVGLILALFGRLWGPDGEIASGFVIAVIGFILAIIGVIANVLHRRLEGKEEASH